MSDTGLPEWMEEADLHAVGVLTLDDGERMTAEVVGFVEDSGELEVDVISSNRRHRDGPQAGRAIPVSRILSFEPQPSESQPWPHSDPCRQSSFSPIRFVLMATMLLCLVPGCLILFILLTKRPYGLQLASAITYTIFEVWSTFVATGKSRLYSFTCPAVQPQFSLLLLRHLGFLIALFVLQTAALAAYPNLPDWWHVHGKGGSPFDITLRFMCMGLALVQVFTNRRLLERAHREFSG